jgi:hypothetical protein
MQSSIVLGFVCVLVQAKVEGKVKSKLKALVYGFGKGHDLKSASKYEQAA